MLDPKQFALFGIIAAVGAFWSQLRGFITKIFSFFIRTDKIVNYEDARNFIQEILKEGKIIRWGNTLWNNSYREYLKKYNTHYHFVFAVNEFLIIKHKKTFLVIKAGDNGGISVTYLFGTFNLEKHLTLAYEGGANLIANSSKTLKRHYVACRGGKTNYAELVEGKKSLGDSAVPTPPSNSDSVFRQWDFLKQHNKFIGISHLDIGKDVDQKTQTAYYWSKEAVQLRDEVEFWLKNKNWFEERGIRWVRSSLLMGCGGTGKSKATLEIAKYFDLPLYRLDVSTMSNEEFEEYFYCCEYQSMVIIEDLDSTFIGRENVHAKNSHQKQLLTFDHFINVVNGVRENSGIFLVVTSNHPEKLDPVIKRAGRLDAKIEFKPLDKEGREFVAANVLKGYEEEIPQIVLDGEGFTVVEFQNKCVELALEKFNQKKIKL